MLYQRRPNVGADVFGVHCYNTRLWRVFYFSLPAMGVAGFLVVGFLLSIGCTDNNNDITTA